MKRVFSRFHRGLWLCFFCAFSVFFSDVALAQDEDEDAPLPREVVSAKKSDSKKSEKAATDLKKLDVPLDIAEASDEVLEVADEAPEKPEPRNPPKIDLLIVGPGDSVFTLYGHAALLVHESSSSVRSDRVFNFGVTEFNRPNYILDFLTGKVSFFGAERSFQKSLRRWKKEDRTVWRYPLNLTPAQASALRELIETAILPENRDYIYDTFRENCATRIRDYLDQVTGGAIFAALGEAETGRAYRDDVRVAFANMLPLQLLVEMTMGMEMDRLRTKWELAYHPLHMAEFFQKIEIGKDDSRRPLMNPGEILYERQGENPLGESPNSGVVFLFVLAGLLAIFALLLGKCSLRARGVTLLLFSLASSIWGAALIVIEAFTLWPDARETTMILLSTPLDLFLIWPAIRLLRKKTENFGFWRGYLVFRLLCSAVVCAATLLVPMFRAPLAPRVFVLAGVFVALRTLTRTLPPVREISKNSTKSLENVDDSARAKDRDSKCVEPKNLDSQNSKAETAPIFICPPREHLDDSVPENRSSSDACDDQLHAGENNDGPDRA